jgi:hypothetical protein
MGYPRMFGSPLQRPPTGGRGFFVGAVFNRDEPCPPAEACIALKKGSHRGWDFFVGAVFNRDYLPVAATV